jgi:hypothetical protein
MERLSLQTLSFPYVKSVGCYIQQKVHNRPHHIRAIFVVAFDNRVSCSARILSVSLEVSGGVVSNSEVATWT